MTWFLLVLPGIVVIALVLAWLMSNNDAAASSFALRFRALGSEFSQANAAARRYEQLLAKRTPPDEAAASLFRSHYQKRVSLKISGKTAPSGFSNPDSSSKKSLISGSRKFTIN